MPPPGIEPGSPRPQRGVLATILGWRKWESVFLCMRQESNLRGVAPMRTWVTRLNRSATHASLIDSGRIWTCAGKPMWFLVTLLNHSDTLSYFPFYKKTLTRQTPIIKSLFDSMLFFFFWKKITFGKIKYFCYIYIYLYVIYLLFFNLIIYMFF